MVDISPLALRVTLRNIRVYSKNWLWSFMPNLFEPIFYLAAMGLGLGGYLATSADWKESVPYIVFMGTGLIAQAALFSPTFELLYGGYTRLTHQKIYDAILATPVSVDDLTLGETLWGAFRSVWYGMLIVLVISLFGLCQSPWALLIPIPLFIAGIFFSAIALCFVATAMSYDYFNFYVSLLLFPMFLFSGIFFPLTALPPWAQTLAWYLPLTHLVELCRNLALGRVNWSLLPHLIWFVVAAVPALGLAMWLMRRRLIK
ncbi:MAG: ABC transporter permease [Cyanobacteria bacterium NC_groundwater_1444_Ag_S-0.65um_54_12]|nr:ABC transporter permease [Cyanobacteria bacterium NC_groundwater_1444_Ag_S-0.65um_54_12]